MNRHSDPTMTPEDIAERIETDDADATRVKTEAESFYRDQSTYGLTDGLWGDKNPGQAFVRQRWPNSFILHDFSKSDPMGYFTVVMGYPDSVVGIGHDNGGELGYGATPAAAWADAARVILAMEGNTYFAS